MTRIRARWVFPGDAAPIEHAVVTLADGVIQAVERRRGDVEIDLPEAAIIPGLLNAHTHLEFSNLAQPIEPRRDFANWIRNVIAERRGRPGIAAENLRAGLLESLICGTTGLAEIATSDVLIEQFRIAPPEHAPRVLIFREILGLDPQNVGLNLEAARAFIRNAEGHGFRDIGISPHAPYSLHPELLSGLWELAADRQLPVAMHLAESRAELELLAEGTGPLVELLTGMGLWQRGLFPLHSRPMTYLRSLAELPRSLIIHGNYLDDDELAYVADHPRMSVVYCPRTHVAMQADPHPWQRMLALGVNVCLGTDSRASNPDLSIWEELRFLARQFPKLPVEMLLNLATTRTARALDWNSCGRLEPGADADLCLVSLTQSAIDDPQRLFEGSIRRTMRAGCWSDFQIP
jgi:cytosine/adenosine deaminase-related metal-dependent hydrolase